MDARVGDAAEAAWVDVEGALAAGAGEETGLATGGVEGDADAAVSAVTI